MKRRYLAPLLLLSGFSFIVFMVSCGKQGATGPAGPKGDSASGAVIYSDWLDVSYKADTVHTTQGGIDTLGFYATIAAPKLTLAMLNTADVKVYINTSDASDPEIYPLPYNGQSGLYIQVSAYTQAISLYSNGQVGTATVNGKKVQQYRYMIVPGNTGARSAANVNWSDYTAVKAYLGLKD